MKSEMNNEKLSLIVVQDALLETIKTETGMNSLDIKSQDIAEPYVSIQSAYKSDSSSKTIRRDTFTFSIYIVVKNDGNLDISNAVQILQDSLNSLTDIEEIKVECVIKDQSVRVDNTNSYAFLEIDVQAVYGYKCK